LPVATLASDSDFCQPVTTHADSARMETNPYPPSTVIPPSTAPLFTDFPLFVFHNVITEPVPEKQFS